MENDDQPVGRILSRREVLALLGGSGIVVGGGANGLFNSVTRSEAAPAAAAAVPKAAGCVAKPELTIGPYFVDEKINRSDVRSDPATGAVKPGILLQLTFNVTSVADACAPLQGLMVDIWQCDALGLYSDIEREGSGGQKFLRGYQVTDANGLAHFTTIYPGWYQGRTPHIHFRIRSTTTSGKTYDFISQLFFPEAVTDRVHAQQPYVQKGQRDMTNSRDNIYSYGGGDQLLLALTQTTQGYAATIDIGMLETTQARGQAMSQPPGGPGGGGPGQFNPQSLRSTLQRAGFNDTKLQEAVVAFATAQNTARQTNRNRLREMTQQATGGQITDVQARESLHALRQAISAEKARAAKASKELDQQIGYSKSPRLELVLTTMGLIGEASTLGINTGMMGGPGGPGGPPPGGFGGPPLGGFGGPGPMPQ
jgi:protocatechuate 3,4-dioxygenase beta subunit